MLSGEAANNNCMSIWFDPTRARTCDLSHSKQTYKPLSSG